MKTEITEFETTLSAICNEYGVDIPDGFDGTEPVRVYRDADEPTGWAIGSTLTGPAMELGQQWSPEEGQVESLYEAD